MIKYEYKVTEIGVVKLEAALNDLGAQGFELVAADFTNHGVYRLVLIRQQPTGKLALLET